MSIKGIRTRDGIEMFEFLPLTGGILTGDFTIKSPQARIRVADSTGTSPVYAQLYVQANGRITLASVDKTGTSVKRWIVFEDDTSIADVGKAFKVGCTENKTNRYYNIFGEHNKPSGTYTGNGDAASRSITVGGTGSMLLIRGTSIVLVSSHGAIVQKSDGTVYSLQSGVINLRSGVLTIATTDNAVNKNDRTFTYELL